MTYLDDKHIISLAKHYAAYGNSAGGLNAGPSYLDEMSLRDVYLKVRRIERAETITLTRLQSQNFVKFCQVSFINFAESAQDSHFMAVVKVKVNLSLQVTFNHQHHCQ